MVTQYARRHFTVDEYHKMVEAGILSKDDHVELLDGEIVKMIPINVPHAVCVDRLTMLFAPALVGRGIVRIQAPIYIDEINEPEPDVILLKMANYLKRQPQHPGPDDILLVIEVADATVRSDRRDKIPRYARAGISEAWLVNIPKKVIEVYSDLVAGKYQAIQRVSSGQSVSPKGLPDISVAVDDILG